MEVLKKVKRLKLHHHLEEMESVGLFMEIILNNGGFMTHGSSKVDQHNPKA